MTTLLPNYMETLVIPRPAEEVLQRLATSTSNQAFLQPHEPILLFNGWVHEDRFRISVRSRRVNHFLPLAIGRLENSSTGCILLIRYSLLPTTRLLLKLWTILIVLGTVMGWFQSKSLYVPLIATSLLLLIYYITWSNFNIHLKPLRKSLHRLLS